MRRLTFPPPRQRITKTDTLKAVFSSRLHFSGGDGGGFHVGRGDGRKLEARDFTTRLISGAE